MLAIRAYLLVDYQVNAEATPDSNPPPHGTRPPTAEQRLAFDGRIFAPTGPGNVVLRDSVGWSGTPDSDPSLNVSFLVGLGEDTVIVESSTDHGRSVGHILFYLMIDVTRQSEPRFPLLIKGDKTRIPVEGRERVFRIHEAREAVVDDAAIRGVEVLVRCSHSRLRTVELGLIDPAEWRRVFRKLARRHARYDRMVHAPVRTPQARKRA
jgi:hypothetical protein